MTRPARIRLSRAKGWRKPEGAVVVARPSRWGNPWPVDRMAAPLSMAQDFSHIGCCNALWEARFLNHRECRDIPAARYKTALGMLAAEAAVAQFRALAEHFAALNPSGFATWIEPLRGRDLCCWCPLDAPCHADVLLEIANR